MVRSRQLWRWCPILAIVAGLGAAAADADPCYMGVRRTTKAEREFTVQTLNALRDAVPALPGWRTADETEIREPLTTCIGQERAPMSLDYRVRLVRDEGAAPIGEPEGGPSRRLQPESADLAPFAEVRISVNSKSTTVHAAATPVAVEGVPFAFRSGCAELLLGDWSVPVPDADAAGPSEAWAHFDAELPSTRVQTLVVELDGEAGSVEALLRRLDVRALVALVRH